MVNWKKTLGLVGILAALSIVNREINKPEQIQNSLGFHEVWKKEENTFGQKGAMTYLLNNEGLPISLGYHEIRSNENGFEGNVGACYFKLDKDGKLVRTQTLPSYCATAPTIFGRENENVSIYRRN